MKIQSNVANYNIVDFIVLVLLWSAAMVVMLHRCSEKEQLRPHTNIYKIQSSPLFTITHRKKFQKINIKKTLKHTYLKKLVAILMPVIKSPSNPYLSKNFPILLSENDKCIKLHKIK